MTKIPCNVLCFKHRKKNYRDKIFFSVTQQSLKQVLARTIYVLTNFLVVSWSFIEEQVTNVMEDPWAYYLCEVVMTLAPHLSVLSFPCLLVCAS